MKRLSDLLKDMENDLHKMRQELPKTSLKDHIREITQEHYPEIQHPVRVRDDHSEQQGK